MRSRIEDNVLEPPQKPHLNIVLFAPPVPVYVQILPLMFVRNNNPLTFAAAGMPYIILIPVFNVCAP